MRKANGGEAEFGESWIVMWRAEDLVERNAAYNVKEFPPGFTFFGSNRAGEAYAWDWRPTRQARYVGSLSLRSSRMQLCRAATRLKSSLPPSSAVSRSSVFGSGPWRTLFEQMN